MATILPPPIVLPNPLASPIYGQPILTPSQKMEITAYVNAYRTKNQAPPLQWDDTIYTFSESWAYYLDVSNVIQHSGNPLYGENIAFLQGYGVNIINLMKKSIDLWYNEIALYNFNNPGFTENTGHFTCLVWKSSTHFAMGISINYSTDAVFITMNTSPPGNYIGEFEQNVLPTIVLPPCNMIPPAPIPGPKPNP
jgi:uncharacterized protein YkwD